MLLPFCIKRDYKIYFSGRVLRVAQPSISVDTQETNMFSSDSGDNSGCDVWRVNPDVFWRLAKTCACFSWLPITVRPIMSINASPTLNRHDPTNPHPVSVVSGWNPAEECPELTRISLGLSGITQAGEGLSMIASLGWGGWRGVGVYVCVCVCMGVCALGHRGEHVLSCLPVYDDACVYWKVQKTLNIIWF